MKNGFVVLSDTDLLTMATVFDIFHDKKRHIKVEARHDVADGSKVWAVVNEAKFVLNSEGGWEYEQPMVAARTDDFLASTRWDDLHEAVMAAQAAAASLETTS